MLALLLALAIPETVSLPDSHSRAPPPPEAPLFLGNTLRRVPFPVTPFGMRPAPCPPPKWGPQVAHLPLFPTPRLVFWSLSPHPVVRCWGAEHCVASRPPSLQPRPEQPPGAGPGEQVPSLALPQHGPHHLPVLRLPGSVTCSGGLAPCAPEPCSVGTCADRPSPSTGQPASLLPPQPGRPFTLPRPCPWFRDGSSELRLPARS